MLMFNVHVLRIWSNLLHKKEKVAEANKILWFAMAPKTLEQVGSNVAYTYDQINLFLNVHEQAYCSITA